MRLFVASAFASLFVSSVASAQPSSAASPEASPPSAASAKVDEPAAAGSNATRWYGWQTLAVDGALLTIGLLPLRPSDSSANTAFALGWYGGYALGAPIVHWAHGHVGKGFGSLGMRLGGPLAGALLGVGVALATGASFGVKDSSGNQLYVGTGDRIAEGGVILGMLAPVIIDAAVLAREPVEGRSAVGSAKRSAGADGFRLTGGPVVLRGGGGLSAGGTF